MSIDFKKYARKGNEFLNRLAIRLGDPENKDRAGRILRAVLHTIRDHITTEESVQLLAQLPMALKAIYVDGWKISHHHSRVHTLESFMAEVINHEGVGSWRDFSSPEEITQAVKAVWETLNDYVSSGELEDVAGELAKPISAELMGWLKS